MDTIFVSVKSHAPICNMGSLRADLEQAFPREENRLYLDSLMNSALPRVTLARLSALALLPPLLQFSGVQMDHLILTRDKNNRPYCHDAHGTFSFDFNLSHSDAHVACALLFGGNRIGVDIEEPIPTKRALPLIERYCTEGEKGILHSLSDEAQSLRFTQMWTMREAIGKQEGCGAPLRYDTTQISPSIVVSSGILPDTNASISICYPYNGKKFSVLSHPDSLPILWQ